MSSLWEQYRSVVEFAFANAIFGLSTWIAMWAGVFSLAGASFGAVGGFTAAHLDLTYGSGPAVQLLAGAVGGLLAAAVLSVLLLKLESHWMAMATIALILITRVVVLSAEGLTGGSVGTGLFRRVDLITIVVLVAVICFALARLRHSKFGLAAHAVREDAAVAAALGINPFTIRATAFAASGMVAGVGGVVLANLLQYIGPDTFYITLAFTMAAAMVLGGTYHWAGPLVGAIVFVGLPEVVRSYIGDIDELITGALLVVIMVWLPRGLVDPQRRLPRRRRRGSQHTPVIEPTLQEAAR
ncbi:branched-chain amino acid transport system permease protein [Nocardioides marinisabuli]|uniref:Branched-chain amino acid transport system permease protein n=1 Tax=Nocardioides marinisabuli TaxID=419476 RepID=A0A7Y9JTG6_9ACTN|nr:branched-chain amino acid ABC transporter permease [Nocardioides marinisabuli]NYD59528.1 branched-chain amino acid transport system permease protein [Nocardioides marinisabuli]